VGDDGLDIWIKELDDGALTRLTRGEGEERFPRWSPGGQRVTYVYAGPGAAFDVFSRAANGTGDQDLVFDHETALAQGFYGPDGEWLILRTITGSGASTGRDILAVRPGVDSVARPLLVEEYGEGAPALSPAGRWLAYNSNETGRYEVYVRPFPDVDADKVLVSTAGGIAPLWAHSGSELFYVDGDNNMVAATLEADPGLRVLERQTLFPVPPGTMPRGNQYVTGLYDITPDDQRFLMARVYVDPNAEDGPEQVAAPSAPRLILVQSFFEVLKEQVGN
jgi:Tol biopolymer transport system component